MDYSNLYSKVKSVYYEVNNYTFFHSPSSTDKVDSRFIGRKNLINKLRGFLNDSETKSGAYLITGYRGVGKTSLVNKVLSEITNRPSPTKFIQHQAWPMLFLFIFWIVGGHQNEKEVVWILSSIIILVVIAICSTRFKRTPLKKYAYYLIRGHKSHEQFYLSIVAKFIVSALAYLGSQLFEEFFKNGVTFFDKVYLKNPITNSILFFYVLVASLWILHLITSTLKKKKDEKRREEKKKDKKQTWGNKKSSGTNRVKLSLIRFLIWFKNWINYSNRIVISLNLGHEKLKESDILKVITKDVAGKYERLNSIFWRFPFNFKMLKLLIILSAVQWLMAPLDQQGKVRKDTINNRDSISAGVRPPQVVQNIDIYNNFESTSTPKTQSKGSSILDYIRQFISYCEKQINWGYNILYKNIFKSLPEPLNELPEYPNYPKIIVFILIWYGFRGLAFLRPFNITSHTYINQRLKKLSLRISAEVSKEYDQKIGNKYSLFRLFGQQKITYPIADVREIESELISIFEDIDKIPPIMGKPSFVFVADELDKIQANQNKSISDKESQESNLEYTNNEFIPSTEITRQRRQVVASLLANLKHFFTTVRAKFIFIAGREMFDASLADVSDRNYFLGSIFHEVLYVPSFLTEQPQDEDHNHSSRKGHMSYHQSSVEEFVCQFIIPKEFRPSESRSLKTINKYFKEKEGLDFNEENIDEQLTPENQDKLLKVTQMVFFLKSFINYLSHRSSGNPKKLNRLFEEYLVKYNNGGDLEEIHLYQHKWLDEIKLKEKAKYWFQFLAENGKSHITLSDDKLKLEFKRYIVNRINIGSTELHGLKRELHIEESDLKYNRIYLQFKSRDIYIFNTLSYLTTPFYHNISRHVRRYGDKLMVSSSYLLDHFYKFHNVGFSWRNLEVTPEIIDINKAPSLRKLMHEIVDFLAYSNLEVIGSGLYDYKFNSKVAHEIDYLSKVSEKESAALNFTLDESQEIKKHFKRKLKLLYKENPWLEPKTEGSTMISPDFLHSTTLLLQNLGDLHYYDQEYDDAINAYQNAIHSIRTGKDKLLPPDLLVIYIRIMLKLGLTFEKKKSFQSALMVFTNLTGNIINSLNIDIEKQFNIKKRKNREGVSEVHLGYKSLGLEIKYDYTKDITEMFFSKERFDLLNKSITVESMCHLFQPFISKLYGIEKLKSGGIDVFDLRITLEEISFLLNIVPQAHRKNLQTEYYNKIGDLLFFKNSKMDGLEENLQIFFDLDSDILDQISTPSERFYYQALSFDDDSKQIFEVMKTPADLPNWAANLKGSFEKLKLLANTLSDLAEAIMSNIHGHIKTQYRSHRFYDFLVKGVFDGLVTISPSKSDSKDVERCIFYFRASYFVHLRNNDHKRAAYQYLKILHLIVGKAKLQQVPDGKKGLFIEFVKNEIVNKILESFFRTYNASTRTELEKDKSIFKFSGSLQPDFLPYLVNHLPQTAEIQETISLYNFIRIQVSGIKLDKIKQISPGVIINPNNTYARAIQLSVKVRANNKLFKEHHNPHSTPLNKLDLKVADRNRLEYLICDSIYCLTELIRILQNFGINYLANHSFYGFAFEKRATWADRLKEYLENDTIEDPPFIMTRLRKLIGSESMDKLRPKYNNEKALDHYKKCIEQHEGLFVYNSFVNGLHYMDDDFNDEYLHFYTALERSKLQTIKKRIKKIETELKTSRIYEVKHFILDS